MTITKPTQWLNECMESLRRYLKQESADTSACFELLRNAFETDNQEIWEVCYVMLDWRVRLAIASHSLFPVLGENVETFVNPVITRFWTGVRPKYDCFPNAPAFFKYLRMCVHTELVEHWRKRSAGTVDLLTLSDIADEEQPCSSDEILRILCTILADQNLLLLCELRYMQDMKPREIYTHPQYSKIWPDQKSSITTFMRSTRSSVITLI